MNFSEQIKKIRQDHQLTQQEIADKLGVSRQAVSNWENDRNLPDIELLIGISKTFQISLDQLILGEDGMTNLTQKLIDDGSENRRLAMNLAILKVGLALFVASILLFLAGLFGLPSMENFFALASRISLYSALLTFLILGLKNASALFSENKS